MALFMVNECTHNRCGRIFPSLGDLIFHIEDSHIDYDPLVIERLEASRPACVPLSYIMRFFTEATRRAILNSNLRRRLASIVRPSFVRGDAPDAGGEFYEEAYGGRSEDSDDSWTTAEEFSAEYILRYGTKINRAPLDGGTCEKPFACPVPGCKKRYKNVNGIKYHSKNGHKKDGKIKKAFKCRCGKSYKSSQGLKNHSALHYSRPTSPASSSSAMPRLPKLPSLPATKVLRGYVGSSQSGPSLVRRAVRPADSTFFNDAAVGAALESGGGLARENFTAAAGRAVPRFDVGNLQINIPNANNIPMHHANFETDASYFDALPSQSPANYANISSHGGPFDNNILHNNNNLGILTPASSPISINNEKAVRMSKDDYLMTPAKIGRSPSHQMNLMPLTPSTPGDSPDHFTIPNNMVTH